jgi:YidC/Oxa1 family membrane protein insertase
MERDSSSFTPHQSTVPSSAIDNHMENRRLFSFLMVTLLFFWVWANIVVPNLFPPPPQQVQQDANSGQAKQEVEPASEAVAESGSETPAKTDTPPIAELTLPDYPSETIELGSLEPDSGYALRLRIAASGAAIEDVELTDPRYRDLKDTAKQAKILGNNVTRDRTFTTAVDLIDQQLAVHGESLETINWERVPNTVAGPADSVTYQFTALDGSLRVEKTYSLPRRTASPDGGLIPVDTDPSAYTIEVAVRVVNLSDSPKAVTYELQGPVGMLLENAEHTYKYRDIKIEFLGENDDLTVTAGEVQDWVADYQAAGVTERDEVFARLQSEHKWTGAYRYAGIDVQFFAALVAPLDSRSMAERIADSWIDRTYPVLIHGDPKMPRASDISFRMQSKSLELTKAGAADDAVEHKYALFVGPKRKELLDPEPLVAARVLDYGWFGLVARGMHWLLSTFHAIGLPYFLCIICLTVLVRGCLFPLSRKQAISAAKMKELQPRIQELKTKYGDDREKLARAQMELWRKHKINPLAGCLPLFLQLPVFIGLYTALNSAVDLRLASFLWIDNLAAPDQLFRMSFSLPFLGQDFNLLPILTVFLFMAQQKMFMPPAVDEQTEAQYKMMNIMTLMFGFMFWHQASGLCIYFIASSVWSIAERKLLGTGNLTPATVDGDDETDARVVVKKPGNSAASDGNQKEPPRVPGFLQRMMDAAKEVQEQADKSQKNSQGSKKKRKR